MVVRGVNTPSGASGGAIFNARGELAGVLWGCRNGEAYGCQVGWIHVFLSDVTSPPAIDPIEPDQPDIMDLNLVPIKEAIADLTVRVEVLEGKEATEGPVGPSGPAGPPGPPGMNGADGKDGQDAEFDVDAVAQAIIEKLPPVIINLEDSHGNVAQQLTARLGEPIRLPPVRLSTLNNQGEVHDEIEAPLGESLGLRSRFFTQGQ
jgi:hypothetical protein